MKCILGLVVVLFTLNSICVMVGAKSNVAKTSDYNQDPHSAMNLKANEPIQTDMKTGSFAQSNFTTDDNNFKLQSGHTSESKTITGSNYAMRTDSKTVQTITRISPKGILSESTDSNAKMQLPVTPTKQSKYANSQMNSKNLIFNEKEARTDMYPSTFSYNKADNSNSENGPINLPKIDTENILANGKRYINADELKNIFVKKYGDKFSGSKKFNDEFGDIILPDLNDEGDLNSPSNANNGDGSIILPNFTNENEFGTLHNEINENRDITLSNYNSENSFSTDAEYLQTENRDESLQTEGLSKSITDFIGNPLKFLDNKVATFLMQMLQNQTICVPLGSINCTPIQLGGKDINGNGYNRTFSNLRQKIEKIVKLSGIKNLFIQKARKNNINRMNKITRYANDYRKTKLSSKDCDGNTFTSDNSLPHGYEPSIRPRPTPANLPGIYKSIFLPVSKLKYYLKNYAGNTASRSIRFNSKPTNCYNCEIALSDLTEVIENAAKKIVSKIGVTEKTVKNIFNLMKIYVQSTTPNLYNSAKLKIKPMLRKRRKLFNKMDTTSGRESVKDGDIETGSYAESTIKTGSGSKSKIASSNFLNANIKNGQKSGMKMGGFTEESYRNDLGQVKQIKLGAVQDI